MIKWRAPKTTPEVDRRVVVNPAQARALLEAVWEQNPAGLGLSHSSGFFTTAGCAPRKLWHCAARTFVLSTPASEDACAATAEQGDQWGELQLRAARPDAGRQWTDGGTGRDSRGLKHRAEGESRRVPCPPPLVRLLHEHLTRFGGQPDQLVFRGVQGSPLATITYRRAWDKARRSALTEHEYRSALARRPYDLRHACLSDLAQRRCGCHPSCRMGRSQRRDAPSRLRQMPGRSRRDRQAKNHCGAQRQPSRIVIGHQVPLV